MAVETLDAESGERYRHHLVHELESILYTAVWQGVGYKGARPPTYGNPLATWRRGTWSEVYSSKRTFIDQPAVQLTLISYEHLRMICDELCSVFSKRYAEEAIYNAWIRRMNRKIMVAHDDNDDDDDDPYDGCMDDSQEPKISEEPPIPSNAVLPSFMVAARLKFHRALKTAVRWSHECPFRLRFKAVRLEDRRVVWYALMVWRCNGLVNEHSYATHM